MHHQKLNTFLGFKIVNDVPWIYTASSGFLKPFLKSFKSILSNNLLEYRACRDHA